MKQDTMEDCPRFIKCSAPICPLDEDMKRRVRLVGEDICTLRNFQKRRLKQGKPLTPATMPLNGIL